ncbi:unnamed protein product, partial [Ectocarpus fasciculatus]
DARRGARGTGERPVFPDLDGARVELDRVARRHDLRLEIRGRVRPEGVEGTDVGHAAPTHERSDRLHVPHLLQRPRAYFSRGDAGGADLLRERYHGLRYVESLAGGEAGVEGRRCGGGGSGGGGGGE